MYSSCIALYKFGTSINAHQINVYQFDNSAGEQNSDDCALPSQRHRLLTPAPLLFQRCHLVNRRWCACTARDSDILTLQPVRLVVGFHLLEQT